ncbi:MAG: alpha/beta fold hydrolase [Herminiimonas sp.]|nr:alpha/beta fold hydrolase [Herminiimonas sp.]
MIARITRILLLVQLAVAVLLAMAVAHRWPQLSMASAALFGIDCILLLRAAIVANNFRVAARFAGASSPGESGLSKLLRMYLDELRATLVSSSWHMPFCRLGAAPEIFGHGVPVLLVHGYGCNSGYWQPMARAFRLAGISFHATDLEPVLGDIDGYLPQISRAVAVLCAAAGTTQVVIVAHSMGGLVARAWLRDNGWQQVAALITLGTPHQGTVLAQFGIGSNARQMCRIDDAADPACNPWLVRLNGSTDEKRERIVSLYSTYDNIVVPSTSGCLAGAHNVSFPCIGHVALASRVPVIACVIEHIRQVNQSMSIQEKPAS